MAGWLLIKKGTLARRLADIHLVGDNARDRGARDTRRLTDLIEVQLRHIVPAWSAPLTGWEGCHNGADHSQEGKLRAMWVSRHGAQAA
jgi:hypothetical protein